MCRCCEIIKYWLCCYKKKEDDYDIQVYIDWSDDTLYGAVEKHKENNDTN